MATYDELIALNDTPAGTALQRRVRVAVLVAADVVRLEAPATSNHANRMAWARNVLSSPDAAAKAMLWAVLVQNRAVSQALIASADDATVQTAVNNAIDLLAGV